MISTAELAQKEFTGITLPDPYGRVLGEIPMNASAAIWGPKGSGKSTMAVALAYVLAEQIGKGIYCSSEEGPGPSMQGKIKRLKAEHEQLLVTDFDGLQDLKSAIKYSGAKFIVLDSASMGYVKLSEFESFHDWCKDQDVMLFYILHATKEGNYKGNTMMVHMPDIEIKVADGIARTEKNRFQETPREMEVVFERGTRSDASNASEDNRLNPEVEFHGIPYIENPDKELRENKAVKPDEIYQMITDMVINTIEEVGHLPWEEVWEDTGLYSGRVATNFVSKNAYRGINYFLLNFEQVVENGKPVLKPKKFKNPYFMTFNQVDERGGKVKKGSTGFKVVYFTRLYQYSNAEDPDDQFEFSTYDFDEMVEWLQENRDRISMFDAGFTAEEIARQSYIPILKYYNVFNGEDIEGIDFGTIPSSDNSSLPDEQKIEIAELIYEHYPNAPEVKHLESKAYYNRDGDFINMPDPTDFTDPQFYYSVLFHEAVHSSGHKSRLDRKKGQQFGDKDYSFEELIAEMGAVYLCAESGILFRTIDNSAKYLHNWNERLVGEMKKDNRFFFRAASRAQEASDYILDRDESGIPEYRKHLDETLSGSSTEEKTESEDESGSDASKALETDSDIKIEYGDKTTVDFKADGSIQEEGRYAIVEVADLIPSHNKDCTPNSDHKISKGQPRDRSLDALCSQPKFIAQNLNPSSITRGNLAFNGAPVTLPDVQHIQGNGRGISLKIAKDEHPGNYENYKEYLIDHASQWGFTKQDFERFNHPALVRVLDVSKDRAIELGNIVDTSQAKMSKLDQAKAYIRNLPKDKRQAIGNFINNSTGETITQVINDVGMRIFDQLKDLDRQGLVSDGELTSDGKEFLRNLFAGLVFDSDQNKNALQHFLDLKHTQKAGLERSYGNIIPHIGTEADITPTLQKAVEIAAQVQKSDGIDTVSDFMGQADAFSGANAEKFSEKEAKLAEFLLDADTQKGIRNAFRMYSYKINGKEDLFNPIESVTPGQAFDDAFVKRQRVNPCTTCRVNGADDEELVYLGVVEKLDIDQNSGFDGIEGAFLMFSNIAKDTIYVVPKAHVTEVEDAVDDMKAEKLFEQFHHYEADQKDFAINWPNADALDPKEIGTAETIYYASDKIMRPGDRKGKQNYYKHDFDKGARPVKLLGSSILAIENIEWDERGILN